MEIKKKTDAIQFLLLAFYSQICIKTTVDPYPVVIPRLCSILEFKKAKPNFMKPFGPFLTYHVLPMSPHIKSSREIIN